ncbi:Hypothetical protein D9617_1g085480 [Elsinoe fawcettii]|nr:Hypothetical protein D9617_1g085480 [Elsinoe fawcettii]
MLALQEWWNKWVTDPKIFVQFGELILLEVVAQRVFKTRSPSPDEKKIDRIADRLKSIERLLQEQNTTSSKTSSTQRTDGSSTTTPKTISTSITSPQLDAIHDGLTLDILEATNDSHAKAASGVVESVVGVSHLQHSNAELAAALASLKEIVSRIDDPPSSSGFLGSHPSTEMLEASLSLKKSDVDKLVDTASGSICLSFSPGMTAALLGDRCDSIFTSDGEVDAVRRLYVYATLWYLSIEYSNMGADSTFVSRCEVLTKAFLVRLDRAIHDLKLIMSPTAEAVNALVMAASVAIQLCKPRLAQALSAKAANMVLTLGYHRMSTMISDTEEERQGKILLFWMAYWFDTGFAIRYGQVPVIQNYAISVPRLNHGSILSSTFVEAFGHCTRIGDLQCQVVEQLYSPLAAEISIDERRKRASRLLRSLQEAWAAREQASSCILGDVALPDFRSLLKESDAVIHYSTVALVMHATMATTDAHSPALEPARKALNLTNMAWQRWKHLPDMIWTGHCGWILLLAPITPFVVVLCEIVAHPNTSAEDLKLLGQFVTTLAAQRRFSEGMVKLHKLCDVFWKVALLYVRAKETHSSTRTHDFAEHRRLEPEAVEWDMLPTAEIDEYMSSIGFIPQPSCSENVCDTPLDGMITNTDLFANWYQGNNLLMNVLDQDYMFNNPMTND